MNTSIIEAEILKNFKKDKQARRLFHGRGGCFDGYKNLVIDVIPPYILLDLYDDCDESLLLNLKNLLIGHFGDCIEGIFWRQRKQSLVYKSLKGELPEKHLLWENDLCYEVSFKDNQNIGVEIKFNGVQWGFLSYKSYLNKLYLALPKNFINAKVLSRCKKEGIGLLSLDKKINEILDSEKTTKQFRLILTQATGKVIKKGLYLLGIKTVEKM